MVSIQMRISIKKEKNYNIPVNKHSLNKKFFNTAGHNQPDIHLHIRSIVPMESGHISITLTEQRLNPGKKNSY